MQLAVTSTPKNKKTCYLQLIDCSLPFVMTYQRLACFKAFVSLSQVTQYSCGDENVAGNYFHIIPESCHISNFEISGSGCRTAVEQVPLAPEVRIQIMPGPGHFSLPFLFAIII